MEIVGGHNRNDFCIRFVPNPHGVLVLATVLVAIFTSPSLCEDGPEDQPVRSREVIRVQVTLPIINDVDEQAIREIERRLENLNDAAQRPKVVIEFKSGLKGDMSASRFEDALSLARFLSGPNLRRARTVAFLSESVFGHAVLPVLACEQIILRPKVELGDAGRNETALDPTIRRAYTVIAERRRTVPAPLVLAILDRELDVWEVKLVDGSQQFVLQAELEELRKSKRVINERSLAEPGRALILSAHALRTEFGIATHVVESLRELADALDVHPQALDDDPSQSKEWTAIRLSVDRFINSGLTNRSIRRIEGAMRRTPKPDLVIIVIDSPGGESEAALNLAHYLADLKELRTVAIVTRKAEGAAALIATACDEVFVTKQATLGGGQSRSLSKKEAANLKASVIELTRKKQTNWSLPLALADPKQDISRYRRVNGIGERYLCNAEHAALKDADSWRRAGALQVGKKGLTGSRAVELGMARGPINNLNQVTSRYGVEGELEEARGLWLIETIQAVGSEPWFAPTLLFLAFFALMTELSSPGLGVPGFLASLAFMLFFWAAFLNGTAGWLEVILFLGGLLFIACELFVIPGFGIFGVGGGVMILTSLVLASQTFIIPQNSYQFRIMARSSWLIVGAGGGILGGIWIMSRYLDRLPILNRLTLKPLSGDEIAEQRKRELPNCYAHLVGEFGVASTPLVPAGKAQFGDEIVSVVSEGDLVERGQRICVLEVVGNRVVVEIADINPDAAS